MRLAETLLNGGHIWQTFPLDLHNYAPSYPDYAPSYDEGQKRVADHEFRRRFRLLIDQWIFSGRGPDNVEIPRDRTIFAVPEGGGKTLFDVLGEWLEINRPLALMSSPARIEFSPARMPLAEGRSPDIFGCEYAVYWLTHVLIHPRAGLLVARCENARCGKYYFRQRKTLRSITRGSYCGKCPRIGAAERTKISRRLRSESLISLAASVWPGDWKPTARYKRLEEQVAAAMRKNRWVHVRSNWVTRNRAAIEREVERKKNEKQQNTGWSLPTQ